MRAPLIFGLLALAGCASLTPAPVRESAPPTRVEAPKGAKPASAGDKFYSVKKGDTLFGIAREHKLNPNELMAWNKLDASSRLVVGQQLRVAPPGSASAAAPQGEIEVKPIAGDGPVTSRSLDGAPNAPAPAAALPAARPLPPPSAAPAPVATLPTNDDEVRREPKGGKLAYSEDNLARLRREAAPAALPAAPVPERTIEKPAEKTAPAPAEVDWGWPAAGKLIAGYSEGGAGQEANKGLDFAGKPGEPVLAAAAGKAIFVGTMPKYGNLVVLLHAGGYSSVYAHNSKILVKEGQMVTRGQKVAELGDSDADQPKLHFEIRQQGKPLDPAKFLPPR